MTSFVATDEYERELAKRFGGLVAGIDEVGRGALAGPVTVGVAVVDETSPHPPLGLADSKLLTPKKRLAVAPLAAQWLIDHEIGWASPEEIDSLGIVGALRIAAVRALGKLKERGRIPSVVLLDGSHNWLTAERDLLTEVSSEDVDIPVVTRVKADATCTVVSAASVLAKVARDRLMEELEDPGYDWEHNKGYSSAAHIEALSVLGASQWHRRSWKLPGIQKDRLSQGATLNDKEGRLNE